jgi:hypothetical protein
VVASYKLLVNDATDQDIKLASVLGWCVEWVSQISLSYGNLIKIRLKFWQYVKCHVSNVMYQMSCIKCHVSN